jgi:hypothetical protein
MSKAAFFAGRTIGLALLLATTAYGQLDLFSKDQHIEFDVTWTKKMIEEFNAWLQKRRSELRMPVR